MFGLDRAYEVRANQAFREIDGMPELRFTVDLASCTDNQPCRLDEQPDERSRDIASAVASWARLSVRAHQEREEQSG